MYEEPTEPLKTADEVLAMIATRIGDIYDRPLMYGDTADGVESLLFQLHWIWATASGCVGEYERRRDTVSQEMGCDAMSFASYYLQSHPNTTELQAAEFVVTQWKRISQLCSLPLAAGG